MSQYLYIAEYRDRFNDPCPSHKKIGVANHVPSRMASISDPEGTIYVFALAVWETQNEVSMQKTELMLHRRYKARRLNGEWFSDEDGTLIAEITALLDNEDSIAKVRAEQAQLIPMDEVVSGSIHYIYIAEYRDRFDGQSPSHKKIGFSSHVPARMSSISDTKGTLYIFTLAIWEIRSQESMQEVELVLREKYRDYRLNGNWFSEQKKSLFSDIKAFLNEHLSFQSIDLGSAPHTLPSGPGSRTGHHNAVENPVGRRRNTSREEIVGELNTFYHYLVDELPNNYVRLNDNGPYIRAVKNEVTFYIVAQKKRVVMDFWAGEGTPLHATIGEILANEFDGDAITSVGKGKHEGLIRFFISHLSMSDLKKILNKL